MTDVRLAVAFARAHRWDGPSFICPDCYRFTPHPDDAANSYCTECHQFKNETGQRPRCMEPSCPNFGSYDFGNGTCPVDVHAIPPAARRNQRST